MKLSAEFFPPRSDQGIDKLEQAAIALKPLSPEYFSVTFGAGGSTQTRTLDTVLSLKQKTRINTAPHISGIGQTRADIEKLLKSYQENDVNRLVVLRGDIPEGDARQGDFPYGVDLVRFIRETTGDHFHISVGAYPEFHPEAGNARQDILRFVEKVNAGANCAITQYFFNADSYHYFVDAVRQHQCDVPIIPGIMPITHFEKIARFSALCGAEIPRWLTWKMQALDNDEQAIFDFGVQVIAKMCHQLEQSGVRDFHFYTMNQSRATLAVCQQLNWL